MIIDNHVHIGWFTDGYHTPREVWDSAMAAGIDGMAVSSTSTCAELYKVVVREMRELIRIGGDRIRPVLWLTPRMMKCRYALPYMLHSKIPWQGIKMHWEAHKEWASNRKLVARALDVARKLDVPVLLHTGNFDCCHAGLFRDLIINYQDLSFVLAHGRPITEAIDILNSCDNVWVDTAFMPKDDLMLLAESNFSEKILFGSDIPINKVFYHEVATSVFIHSNINMIQQVFGEKSSGILSRSIYV